MTQDVVVPLLDGQLLVLDAPAAAGPRLQDELEIWALVPAAPDAETRRGDPAIWVDALLAGQLAHAVFHGVADDSTAWKIFPLAAKFLTASLSRGRSLDAVDAAMRARHRVAALTDEDPLAMRVLVSRLDEQGNWHIELAVTEAGVARVTMTPTGTATLVDLHMAPPVGRGSPAATALADAAPDGPRVFVCYAHDTDEHKQRVREFVEFLITHGIEAHMDAWEQQERRDWQLWATGQIKAAHFVLVIASPKCRQVGDGENAPDEHRGLRSEMNLLRELYHAQPDVWPKRILPVVLTGYSIDDIPSFLQPHTADHYLVAELTVAGAEDLLRHLTRQPPYVPPPRGDIPLLAPHPNVYRQP